MDVSGVGKMGGNRKRCKVGDGVINALSRETGGDRGRIYEVKYKEST